MRKQLTIAAIAASACLFAADAPRKPLSADFAKSGRRALIAARNGIVAAGKTTPAIQSAIDDAEFDAATPADKQALETIKLYRTLLEIHARIYRLNAYTLALGGNPPDSDKALSEDKACGDAIESMLRSGNLTPLPECPFPQK
jgi:hypothetical protein